MCAASHALPSHQNYNKDSEGGTDGHALLCDAYSSVPNANARLESALPGLRGLIDKRMVGVSSIHAEEAYVVDIEKRTSKLLGMNIARQYEKALGRPASEYEIFVSLDLRGSKSASVAHIRDFKFGITSSWWQIIIQCMAVLWSPGCSAIEADAGFLFIDAQDESDLSVHEDAKTFYLTDLDEKADELMRAFGRSKELQRRMDEGLPAADVPVVEGKWCTYCASFPHCPAKWKLAKSMLSLDVVGNVDALTLEQCGNAWKTLAEIKKNIVKKLEDSLKSRLRAEGEFPLPNGKVLRMVDMPGRSSLDRSAVVAMLQSFGATEEDIQGLFIRGPGFDSVKECNPKKR